MTFYLYTDEVNDIELGEDNLYVVDVTLPSVFIIHGWEATSNNSWVLNLTNAYLATGEYNIIAVNWSPIAEQFYPISVAEAKEVGKGISILYICNLLEHHATQNHSINALNF